MAFPNLSLTFLLLSLLPLSTLSQEAPSPAPLSGDNTSPSPASIPFSPPAPPPADQVPTPSPGNSPAQAPVPAPEKSPAPAPVVNKGLVDLQSGDEDVAAGGGGGMSSGKKAGIAVGVIAAFCVVGVGALVYKKRKQNISRAQYSTAARRDFL